MATREATSTANPALSVVIAAYNDWLPLDRCLGSIAQQSTPPTFEVVVVDDGSQEPAPEFIRQWSGVFPLNILRQAHAGVSAARNRGVQECSGALVLFVDADCKLQKDCLAVLATTSARLALHDCFQLHLTGECSGLVGRSEELRLMNMQDHLLQPDGRIRYLNTAAFAIRRSKVNFESGLFDIAAIRGEDTLLLVNLMQNGELPFFLADAIVQHAVPLSLSQYLRKAVRSALLERHTYATIRSRGIRIRVTNRERVAMLSRMWKESGHPNIGRTAFFLLIVRQALPRIVSVLSHLWSLRSRQGSLVANQRVL